MSDKRINAVSSNTGMPKKVKVFDIGEAVEKGSNGKYKVVGETKYAVVEGPNGFLLVDTDGCHRKICDGQEKINLNVAKASAGEIPLFPDAMLPTCINTICELPHNEVELGQFVRRFGDRIENNYRILLQSIKEIGLDSSDFPRGDFEGHNPTERRINSIG